MTTLDTELCYLVPAFSDVIRALVYSFHSGKPKAKLLFQDNWYLSRIRLDGKYLCGRTEERQYTFLMALSLPKCPVFLHDYKTCEQSCLVIAKAAGDPPEQ